MKKNNISHFFIIFVKAMMMGAADVVPGVSGGTIAIISGIYERLINAIASFNISMLQDLLKGRIHAVIRQIDWAFLTPLFLGIACSILTLASLISHLLETYPILVWAFFNGLLISSSVLLLKQYAGKQTTAWLGFILALLFAVWLSTQTQMTLQFTPLNLFIAGFIAISALILPGISGSFILLLLGLYTPVINAIKDHDFIALWPFILGMICGVLLMAQLLKWLLKHFEQITLLTLTGFIIGALVKIWPWQYSQAGVQQWLSPMKYAQIQQQPSNVISAIVVAITGFLLVQLISFLSHSK